MRMGAPQEIIDSMINGMNSKVNFCEIWPENVESFNVFVSLTTQWIVTGMGHYMGIRYASIESALNLMGFNKKRKTELFEDIKTMQDAALEVINEPKK